MAPPPGLGGSGARFGPHVRVHPQAWVHESARVYGSVRLAEGVSVWPNAVIRAEMFEVEIGPFSNVQDGAVVHVGEAGGTRIGAWCSITHHAVVHGATLGDCCLVGINATVMDGCVIGECSIVAGGTFLPAGTRVPPCSVVMGVPGRVVRTHDAWVENRFNAALYVRNARAYARGEHRAWSGPDAERWMAEERARLEEEFARRRPRPDPEAGGERG